MGNETKRILAKHNGETLEEHFNLLKAWLATFEDPDCETGCEGCPFNELLKDDGHRVKVPHPRHEGGEYFTLCSVLSSIRDTIR